MKNEVKETRSIHVYIVTKNNFATSALIPIGNEKPEVAIRLIKELIFQKEKMINSGEFKSYPSVSFVEFGTFMIRVSDIQTIEFLFHEAEE